MLVQRHIEGTLVMLRYIKNIERQRLSYRNIVSISIYRYRIVYTACELNGKRGRAGRKSGGAERSVKRVWQKTMEREQSAEWEVAECGAG